MRHIQQWVMRKQAIKHNTAIMNTYIYTPAEQTTSYPLHHHDHWEIIYYLQGAGVLRTPQKDYPFSANTVLIIPPGTIHGTVSEHVFKGIPIGGDFGNVFFFDSVQCVPHASEDAKSLMEIIFRNRSFSEDYLSSLCLAYCHCLLKNVTYQDKRVSAVYDIVTAITKHGLHSDFDLSSLLEQSGYVKGYIRSCFKKQTGMSPNAFLTHERMQHAVSLLNIYGNNISIGALAEACGYTDAIYFSKIFKRCFDVSPSQYRKPQ